MIKVLKLKQHFILIINDVVHDSAVFLFSLTTYYTFLTFDNPEEESF